MGFEWRYNDCSESTVKQNRRIYIYNEGKNLEMIHCFDWTISFNWPMSWANISQMQRINYGRL